MLVFTRFRTASLPSAARVRDHTDVGSNGLGAAGPCRNREIRCIVSASQNFHQKTTIHISQYICQPSLARASAPTHTLQQNYPRSISIVRDVRVHMRRDGAYIPFRRRRS